MRQRRIEIISACERCRVRPLVESPSIRCSANLPYGRGDDGEQVLAIDGLAQDPDAGQIDLGVDRTHQAVTQTTVAAAQRRPTRQHPRPGRRGRGGW